MFDRFTDRARKVMSFAKLAAEQSAHDVIAPEHMLIGLARETGGMAARVLGELGVGLPKLEEATRKLIATGHAQGPFPQLPFSASAKRILEWAVGEAQSLDHNYVGTEHLLLALARDKDGIPGRVLTGLGVTSEAVRKNTLKLLAPKKPGAKDADMPSIAFPLAGYAIAPHLETLLAGKDLTAQAAAEVAQAIVLGRVPPASLGALVMGLRAKGESVEEIAAFAKVMRGAAIAVSAPPGTLDTCGTGGDKSGTFNISTATALVVAGMGIPVAKHGGRSVSSSAGSADVLKTLGVNIEAPTPCVERCIREAGIGFMFAPAHHPGMKHVAPVRKELGVRTIFNLLGPLANPAGAKLQLLGVCDANWCEKFAQVLKVLGSESVMVVCGAGPGGRGCLDEFSTFGKSTVARLKNGSVALETVNPADFGLAVPATEALSVRTTDQSAAVIKAVLAGQKGPARDIVLLNAAAAALVAGKADAWPAGLALAERSLDDGRARAALEKLVALSNTAP